MVIRAPHLKKNIYIQEVQSESIDVYRQGRIMLERKGYIEYDFTTALDVWYATWSSFLKEKQPIFQREGGAIPINRFTQHTAV